MARLTELAEQEILLFMSSKMVSAKVTIEGQVVVKDFMILGNTELDYKITNGVLRKYVQLTSEVGDITKVTVVNEEGIEWAEAEHTYSKGLKNYVIVIALAVQSGELTAQQAEEGVGR